MLISSGSMGPARRRMFLVDTNVISEARKGRRADPGVVAFWADVARLQTPSSWRPSPSVNCAAVWS